MDLTPKEHPLFLAQLRGDLSNKNVKVGEMVTMPSGRVFNFANDEENYFVVLEKK